METSKILIIGAGASGIGAAVKLLESGFRDVVILEANDRIGGRIHSVPFGTSNSIIDLGAQWVGGNNLIYEIMKDHFAFGDSFAEGELNEGYLSSDGEEIDTEKCKKLHTLLNEIQFDVEELRKSSENYGVFFERKYFEAVKKPEFEGISKKLINQMFEQAHKELNVAYATRNWYQIPANFVGVADYLDGSQTISWKRSGFKTFLDFLIKNLQETKGIKFDDKLLLNKKVVNINWRYEKVVVKCEDGSEFSADHVISTIPHGVLRANHDLLFTPQLPDEKICAIEGIGFGVIGKVFFEFEEKFFTTGKKHFVLLWTESDTKEIVGTDKEWLLQLIGISYFDGDEMVVEALLAGEKMKEFEEYGDEKIIDDFMWLLEKFFKKSFKRPINFNRSRWLSNENFLGSYAFLSNRGSPDSMQVLGRPILDEKQKPKLLFGGEATSHSHQAFVHGAYEMGLRTAQEIINFYDLS